MLKSKLILVVVLITLQLSAQKAEFFREIIRTYNNEIKGAYPISQDEIKKGEYMTYFTFQYEKQQLKRIFSIQNNSYNPFYTNHYSTVYEFVYRKDSIFIVQMDSIKIGEVADPQIVKEKSNSFNHYGEVLVMKNGKVWKHINTKSYFWYLNPEDLTEKPLYYDEENEDEDVEEVEIEVEEVKYIPSIGEQYEYSLDGKSVKYYTLLANGLLDVEHEVMYTKINFEPNNIQKYTFYNSSNEITPFYNTSSIEKKYNTQGKLIYEKYNYVSNENTLKTYNFYHYNEKGWTIRQDNLDSNDKVYTYNEDDEYSPGYSYKTIKYDVKGNEIETAFFNEKGNPINQKYVFYHKISTSYDEKGYINKFCYYDQSGNPGYTNKYSGLTVFCNVMEHDDYGNVSFTYELDKNNKKMQAKDGSFMMKSIYNENSLYIGYALFDENEKPMEDQSGVHEYLKLNPELFENNSINYLYDKNNILIGEESYFNNAMYYDSGYNYSEETPETEETTNSAVFSRKIYNPNRENETLYKLYLDTDHLPAEVDGIHKATTLYEDVILKDGSIRLLLKLSEDRNSKDELVSDLNTGIAKITAELKEIENGFQIITRFYNANNELYGGSFDSSPIKIEEYMLDNDSYYALSHMISETKPQINDNCWKTVSYNTENSSETAYYDFSNKLTNNSMNGFARSFTEFSSNENELFETTQYYNAKNKVIPINGKVFKEQKTYSNINGLLLKVAFFDKKGNKVNDVKGYHEKTTKINQNDQIEAFELYDKKGNKVACKGVFWETEAAVWKKEYIFNSEVYATGYRLLDTKGNVLYEQFYE